MLTDLLERLLAVPAPVVLAVVGTLVFIEDALFVGFVVPGETVAILGGVAASLGHVPLWAVLTVVVVVARSWATASASRSAAGWAPG